MERERISEPSDDHYDFGYHEGKARREADVKRSIANIRRADDEGGSELTPKQPEPVKKDKPQRKFKF